MKKTAKLKGQFPDRSQYELNLLAAQKTDSDFERCIAEDRPIIFIETVLSSTKYQDDVINAKTRGYNIGLVYISVYPPEVIIDRIKTRVLEGGHNVDSQKALARYKKSHSNLIWFAQHADFLLIYDNSGIGKNPSLVAMKEPGKKLVYKVKGRNTSLDVAIRTLQRTKRYFPSLKIE